MAIIYNKIKVGKLTSILFNLMWSLIYFKQLVWPNTQSYLINLSGIVLLPFIYFVAILFILTIPEVKSKSIEWFGTIWSSVFSIALISLFVAIGRYNYIFLLLFIWIEPLKIKFIYNGTIKHLKIKYIVLAIVSFLIISISVFLPKINATVNASAMWMGGIYFIFLAILDLKSQVLSKKVDSLIP